MKQALSTENFLRQMQEKKKKKKKKQRRRQLMLKKKKKKKKKKGGGGGGVGGGFLRMDTQTGVALIANFCVNIAFFVCRTHFSHIAASPYAK